MSWPTTLATIASLSNPSAPALRSDCNNNGIEDALEVAPTRIFIPASNGSCHPVYTFNYSLLDLPQPDTDLEIRIELLGFRTNTPSRYVDVLLNGVFFERLFELDGTNCTGVDFTIVTIPWAQIPDISALEVTLDMQTVECCGPAPFLACVLDYDLYSPLDLNQTGIIDTCECFADLDSDGDVDKDDFAIFNTWFLNDDPRADFVDDETLNLDDITAFADAIKDCG